MKQLFLIAFIIFLLPYANGKEKLTILTEISPPANFIIDGKLVGIGAEIVHEILKRLDEDIEIKVKPWARCYNELQTKPNVMLFSTTRTAERESLFKWVGPLMEVQWIFVAKHDNKIKIENLEDAKKVEKIGVYRADVREQFLRKKGFKNLYLITKPKQYYQMLLADRLDLICTSNIGLQTNTQRLQMDINNFKTVYIMKKYPLYMAFSKQTNDTIVNKWDKVYKQLVKEGFIDKVNKKWLGKFK